MIFTENEINFTKLNSLKERMNYLDEKDIGSELLAEFFFARFPHDIFKETDISERDAITANVHYWNGKSWPVIKSQELKGFLNRILKDDLHIEASCRKHDLISGFLTSYVIPNEDININAQNLFNTNTGVISLEDFKITMASQGENIDVKSLVASKNSWLFAHNDFKENHLTCLSEIEIPETVDVLKYDSDISFLKNTFLKSLGHRQDSFEWLMDLFSACISGERKGDHFTTLFGAPATGKTTLVKFLRKVFGNDYFRTIEPEDMVKKTNGGVRKFYDARFARIINVSETADKKTNASFIKKITGNADILIGDDGETFSLASHIIVDTNHMLNPDEDDPAAFLRRIIYIPFGPKINEKEMDKELHLKLEALKDSFFLNLLLRFVKIQPAFLETPSISLDAIKTAAKFNDPIKFFYEKWCVPALDLQGGKTFKLSEIRRIFVQEFFYDYENEFQKIFYRTQDFHRELALIQKQTFNLRMQNFHHFVTKGHAGELLFHNLIIHHPGTFSTMKEYQRHQLMSYYCLANTKEEADKIIAEAERPPVDRVSDDISATDFRDVTWYTDFPSFSFFGIKPEKIEWEDTILKLLINGNHSAFCSWLNSNMNPVEANRIYQNLIALIQKRFCNFEFCKFDSGIRGILNSLFDFYIGSVRSFKNQKRRIMNNTILEDSNQTGVTPFSPSKVISGVAYSY